MILKVKCLRDNRDWWFISNINRICKHIIINKENTKFDVDLIIFHGKVDTCMRLNCILENGDEYSVVFDSYAYLLNDDGKTIEKFVSNLLTEQIVENLNKP